MQVQAARGADNVRKDLGTFRLSFQPFGPFHSIHLPTYIIHQVHNSQPANLSSLKAHL
mgnify:CR=1